MTATRTDTAPVLLDPKSAAILRRLSIDGLVQPTGFVDTAALMSDADLPVQLDNYNPAYVFNQDENIQWAFEVLCGQWFARFERDLIASAA
jgi:hypothetical protein